MPRSISSASLPVNWSLRGFIDELRIRCRNGVKTVNGLLVPDEGGCPAVISLEEEASHQANCPFAFVVCSFAGCGTRLRRREVNEHDAVSVMNHLAGERSARKAQDARVRALEASSAAAASAAAAAAEATTARLDELGANSDRMARVQDVLRALSLSCLASDAKLSRWVPFTGGVARGPAC